MARCIPPGIVIKNGRIEISVYIELQITSKWLNIDLSSEQIHDNVEYFITTYEKHIDSIGLDLILANLPEDIDKWCQSFEGYMNHTYKIDRNQREIYHMGYIEHDLYLSDRSEKHFYLAKNDYNVTTYDLLNPTANNELYKSEVWFITDECEIINEFQYYKTEEEARNGHQELIKKWFDK